MWRSCFCKRLVAGRASVFLTLPEAGLLSVVVPSVLFGLVSPRACGTGYASDPNDWSQSPLARARGDNRVIGRTIGVNHKLHLAVDSLVMPVRMSLSEGTVADCAQASDLIEGIAAQYLLADRGYDTDAILAQAQLHGMEPVIPPRSDRKESRYYDWALYKLRHLVKNSFLDFKQWRATATRYAKNEESFLAICQIRALVIWTRLFLRHPLVLQRRFKEGCPRRHEARLGAWHESGWPVRYCPAYPPATAATLQVRTVPGAASHALPGTLGAGLSGASFPPQACCRLRRKAPPSRHRATW